MPKKIEPGPNEEDKIEQELGADTASAAERIRMGGDSVDPITGDPLDEDELNAKRSTHYPRLEHINDTAKIETLKKQIEETGPVDDAILRGPKMSESSKDEMKQRRADNTRKEWAEQQRLYTEQMQKEDEARKAKPEPKEEKSVKKSWFQKLFGGK